jgi:hypothetical protein
VLSALFSNPGEVFADVRLHTSRGLEGKQLRRSIVKKVLCLLWLFAALSAFTVEMDAQVCPTCPSFTKTNSTANKKLASLVGCWRGKGPNALAAKVSYQMGSDKSALLETIYIEKNPTMYTMYYMDGEVGMAHHFCSYGNQLRMRAESSSDPNVLLFKLVDSTNLQSLAHNHMNYVKFMFRDQNRFDVEWGLHHNGKDLPQLYVFRRVAQGCSANSDSW